MTCQIAWRAVPAVPPLISWHNWHSALAQAQRAEQGVFSGERRLAPERWRTRGPVRSWSTVSVRAFFESLVAANRRIERVTAQPAAFAVWAVLAAAHHATPNRSNTDRSAINAATNGSHSHSGVASEVLI